MRAGDAERDVGAFVACTMEVESVLTWLREWWSGATAGGMSQRERMVCDVCGGWIEFPRGLVNKAAVEWHAPDSPQETERQELATKFERFMRRHRTHASAGAESIRIYQSREGKFWRVEPGKQESL